MWKPLTMRRQIFRIVLLTASAALHVRRAKRGTVMERHRPNRPMQSSDK
jgi:hypothetical protein